MRIAGWAEKPTSAARRSWGSSVSEGRPAGSSRSAAALLEKRTGPVEVDDHDRVGEAVEDRLELVAVGGHHAEALLQRGAHRLQGAGELADLVEAAALQGRVEGAGRHFLRRVGEALDPLGDRGGDQEAGEDAEADRGEHRARLVAERVDDAGRDQADQGEGRRQPEPHADSVHEGLLTQSRPRPGAGRGSRPGTVVGESP